VIKKGPPVESEARGGFADWIDHI